MQQLSQLLYVPELKHGLNKRMSERASLVGYFYEKLTGYGYSVTVGYIGFRLSHLNVQDLYYLKSICDKSKHFGKTFYGSIKAQ